MPKSETWGAMQRRWGSIVAGYSVEQTKDLIRSVIAADEPFYTYSLLLILKYRSGTAPIRCSISSTTSGRLQKQHVERDEIEAGIAAPAACCAISSVMSPGRRRSSTDSRGHAEAKASQPDPQARAAEPVPRHAAQGSSPPV